MLLLRLQRLSVALVAWLRRSAERVVGWIRTRPRLAAWFFPSAADAADTRYRDFNLWYFSDFHEQERMLADKPRMDFYQAAIARQIHPGDRVIDLGTGTGILAALAARRGAAKVYAIDHSDIIEHARTIAVHNRIENVEFISTHSKSFRLDEPVDVILHEQMGDGLFVEDMVANVADLRDRLLKPGGLILPSRFELFCEPVKVNDRRLVPFLWELEVHGYDYSCMERSRPQNPSYYQVRSSDPAYVDHFLGEPEPVLAIDLQTLHQADLPRELNFSRTVTRAGRLDGFAVWFHARGEGLCLSSGPLDPGRAPHWGFRILRTERDFFEVGDVIDIRLSAGPWSDVDSWRWSCVKRPAIASQTPAESIVPRDS